MTPMGGELTMPLSTGTRVLVPAEKRAWESFSGRQFAGTAERLWPTVTDVSGTMPELAPETSRLWSMRPVSFGTTGWSASNDEVHKLIGLSQLVLPTTDAPPHVASEISEGYVSTAVVARNGGLIVSLCSALALAGNVLGGISVIHPLLGLTLAIAGASFALMGSMAGR